MKNERISCFKRSRISFNLYRNKDGFSLVEILVALGIMSIMALAMATMMANQSKDLKASDEKLGLQNVQLMLTNILSSSAFCRCFVGTNTFNYEATGAARNWNALPTTILSSYDAPPGCGAAGPAVLTLGSPMGSDTSIVPSTMAMQNIVETTTGSGIFKADLLVSFNQSALIRSRKPITIPMGFTVNVTGGAAGARPLVTCSSVSSNSIDFPALCAQLNGFYNTANSPPTCDPTYQ